MQFRAFEFKIFELVEPERYGLEAEQLKIHRSGDYAQCGISVSNRVIGCVKII